MPTDLQNELAARLIDARRAHEEKSAEAENLKRIGHLVAGTLEMVKIAKRELKDAIENVEHISDPEIKELTKQRMLEIWGE